MADDEREDTGAERDDDSRGGRRGRRRGSRQREGDGNSGDGAHGDGADDRADNRNGASAKDIARYAAGHVEEFTGTRPECVIAIDSDDDGWQVDVEVLESRRIPDTQDVLAIYEVQVAADGELRSYRRTRRYARGELGGQSR